MIGISKIAAYIPQRYVKMEDLALDRGDDPQKYLIGIGQKKMSVVGGNEDSISMALNSVRRLLDGMTQEEIAKIKLVIFATESSTDESKAGSLVLREYLGLPDNARYIELKEACYGATAGLEIAVDRVMLHPDEKVVVVASDIARYGLKSKGEVTQGAGSIAILVENKLNLAFEMISGASYYASSIPDFYRPTGESNAIVNGPLSNQTYLNFFKKVFTEFFENNSIAPCDLKLLNFHLPYTKIGIKALREIEPQISRNQYEEWERLFNSGKKLNALVGNIYTGSLYLNLLSNLYVENIKPGDLVGMYSYGSGSMGEFFVLKSTEILDLSPLRELLKSRQEVDVKSYEELYLQHSMDINQNWNSDGIRFSDFYLKEVKNGERIYQQATFD